MDFDVLIIGAGIQGAAVAQAAAVAGYRVCVLEQYPEAARGTSSKSSKLIHGGLRYLETAQFSLVKECLDERAYLLKNAPHLVRLEKFRIPVYRFTSRRRWKIFAGLCIYSLFSRKGFSRVPRRHWGELDGLKTDQLQTVFSYYDAQTDDAALTRAVLASAQAFGCIVHYEAEFDSAITKGEGSEVHFRLAGAQQSVTARVIVNAAGPWVDRVASAINVGETHREIDLVAGSHIELPGEIREGMYYVEAGDGRVVFVMPWKGHTLVGTTERSYTADPADIEASEEEIDYLIEVVNRYFDRCYRRSDVLDAWAGLRVLPRAKTAAFHRPRDTMMVADDEAQPRVVSLYGGKLTAHRHMAQDLLNLIRPNLPDAQARADTRSLPLPRDETIYDK